MRASVLADGRSAAPGNVPRCQRSSDNRDIRLTKGQCCWSRTERSTHKRDSFQDRSRAIAKNSNRLDPPGQRPAVPALPIEVPLRTLTGHLRSSVVISLVLRLIIVAELFPPNSDLMAAPLKFRRAGLLKRNPCLISGGLWFVPLSSVWGSRLRPVGYLSCAFSCATEMFWGSCNGFSAHRSATEHRVLRVVRLDALLVGKRAEV